MTSNYPGALDTLIDPISTNYLNSPSHSAIERAQNAALAALEATVGTTGSAVTTSIFYRLTNPLSIDPGHLHTSSGFSGTMPISKGGTGQTTASAAFNALSPITTFGDLIVGTTSVPTRLPLGTNGYFIRVNTTVQPGLEYVISPALYAVNSDETISMFQTTQIQAPFLGGTNETFWTVGGTWLQHANAARIAANNSNMFANATLWSLVGGTDTQLAFGSTTNLRLKFSADLPAGTDVSGGGNFCAGFIGFTETAGAGSDPTTNGNITITNIRRVGFAQYNGLNYIITCNGTSISATSLGAYTVNTTALYEIILTGTTSVAFYVNGSLAGTISTNIPTSNNIFLDYDWRVTNASSHFIVVSNFVLTQNNT